MKDKPIVFMMVGIPGSGKSTWVKNNRKETWVVVSPDEILETANTDMSGHLKER